MLGWAKEVPGKSAQAKENAENLNDMQSRVLTQEGDNGILHSHVTQVGSMEHLWRNVVSIRMFLSRAFGFRVTYF